jgi:hypothetical protein
MSVSRDMTGGLSEVQRKVSFHGLSWHSFVSYQLQLGQLQLVALPLYAEMNTCSLIIFNNLLFVH